MLPAKAEALDSFVITKALDSIAIAKAKALDSIASPKLKLGLHCQR